MATSIKLADDLKQRLKQLAEQRDRSPHHLMREAIERYVDQEEKRESFTHEAEESLQQYRETGLHITGDELFAWLERRGARES